MLSHKTVMRLLNLPLADLQKYCDKKKNRLHLQELENSLDHLCRFSAARAAYVMMRHGCGCGDQGHDKAVKEAGKVTKKVRKALGYSYP